MCVCVRVTPGPLRLLAWRCLGLGCSRTPPLLAGVLGRVCVCVRALLVPRHSLLGCAVWAFVLGLESWLFPATPDWGVGVCVCSCVWPAYTPPFLAGWCVCVWVLVSSALRCFPGLGAGARGLFCAPHSFPVTFWGGHLWLAGVCGSCRGWGLPPPSLLLFFFGLRGRVSALSCCGFVVSVAGCPGLGSRGPRPPFPSCLGCAFFLAFFLPVSAQVSFVLACPGGPPFRWAAALGWVSPVLAGWSSGLSSGGPVGAVIGAVWLGGIACLLWCGWAASWVWAYLVPPPPFFFFGGGLPVPPSALPGWVHALVGIRCGEQGCCCCLRLAWPCPGPMGRVAYVHAWLGGPSCRVGF